MTSNCLFDGTIFKLVFFGGKGGVGKTSCAVSYALGLALKRPDYRYLLVSTDPAHSIEDSLNRTAVPDNLSIRQLDAKESLEKFKAKNLDTLKKIAARGTFFDDTDIQQVLELSLPGIDELMGFLEISDMAASDSHETVVVDTAPTGHAIRLLEMPKLVGVWLDALDALLSKHRYMKNLFQGSYRKDAVDDFLLGLADSVKRMETLLSSTKTCRFVPVMVAEPLSLFETQELLMELHRANLPVSDLVVNRIFPNNDCPACSDARQRQFSELARFSEMLSGLRLHGVPLYPVEIQGRALTEVFWQGAFELKPDKRKGAERRTEYEVETRVESPAPYPDDSLKLIVFAGKGGVGKTTLACSTALGLGKKYGNKEIFLFSTDPAHSLSRCLEIKVGPDPRKISDNLSAMEIDAKKKFEELKTAYADELETFLTRFSDNMDLVFDHKAMERLMDLAPPGIDEVMGLNMAMEYMADGRYDILVLDSAPTGHLVRLLEMPELMDRWLKVIFNIFLKYKNVFKLPKLTAKLIRLSKDLKILKEVLANPDKSALYAVSIPTEMAFEETCDLVSSCRSMGINIPTLFLNMATRPSPCPLCSAMHEREKKSMGKFDSTFPDLFRPVIYRQPEIGGVDSLGNLACAMYENF